jgi:hypothetical protein
MAGGVNVRISDRAIISALNTPGGAIHEWRDQICMEVRATAQATAPINNPENAQHRGGVVGEYKKGFDWDRRGSSGHHVVGRVTNSQPYAIYVELGRSASAKMQIFSWTAWGGKIKRIGGPKPVRTREEHTPGDTRHIYYNRQLSRGELAYNERIGSGLPPYAGDSTNARDGLHILRDALMGAMGSAGIAAFGGGE